MALSIEIWVQAFERSKGDSQWLSAQDLEQHAIAATRIYQGYADLEQHEGVEPKPDVASSTLLSESEWAIIGPLFETMAELDTAVQLEAMQGISAGAQLAYGRDSATIKEDLNQLKAELPSRVITSDVVTVE